jgi:S1-C subfamily serine protease
VTSGIVSALGRSGLGIEGYEDFIQTDASINPQFGGPAGQLRGECRDQHRDPDAGRRQCRDRLAVPVNMARRVMDQILRFGEVKRGRIGVAIQDLTADLAQAMNTTIPPARSLPASMPGRPPSARAAQRRSGGRRQRRRGARRDPAAQHDRAGSASARMSS